MRTSLSKESRIIRFYENTAGISVIGQKIEMQKIAEAVAVL